MTRKIQRYLEDLAVNGPHIVAMTANAFAKDRTSCLEAGMCEYASKPVQWDALEKILENAYKAVKISFNCRCIRVKDGSEVVNQFVG